jgi:hypothetical protein
VSDGLLVLGALAALGAGCRGRAKEGDEGGSDCRTRAEALGALLAATPHEVSVFMVEAGHQLVVRTDLGPPPELPYAPVVVVGASGTTFQGEPVATPADLLERLRAVHADAEGASGRRGGVDPARLYFQIDRSATWRRVVDAVDAGRAAG